MIEYTVRPGDTIDNIARRFGRSRDAVLGWNPTIAHRVNEIRVGELIRLADADVEDDQPLTDHRRPTASQADTAQTPDSSNALIVGDGQLTFDAEGSDVPGPFFSRVLHVPPGASGVTLGRGYDMKERSPDEIARQLIDAGVDPDMAGHFRDASGLTGTAARGFIRMPRFDGFEISHETQKHLFERTFARYVADVQRICRKSDVVRIYGATDWDRLHRGIRDVVVDLRYRGDYTGATRRRVQPAIVANNPVALLNTLGDRHFWRNVPQDRFKRRFDYLKVAEPETRLEQET